MAPVQLPAQQVILGRQPVDKPSSTYHHGLYVLLSIANQPVPVLTTFSIPTVGQLTAAGLAKFVNNPMSVLGRSAEPIYEFAGNHLIISRGLILNDLPEPPKGSQLLWMNVNQVATMPLSIFQAGIASVIRSLYGIGTAHQGVTFL